LDLAPTHKIGRLSIKVDGMVDYLQRVHDQVKKLIEDNKTKCKAHFESYKCKVTFKVGDLVWVVLTRDYFCVGEYNMLQERKIGFPLGVILSQLKV
jgi:hypothetical protein